jgi:hypothetical protein
MPKSATLTAGKPKRRGAGSKKTPAAIERGLAVAKEGLPLRFVAGAMGVTTETLQQWKKDPEFAQALESARTEGVLLKWRQILKAAEKNPSNSWSALAWALERGYPSEFGRPEVQLGLTVNQSTTNNTLVISVETANELERRAEPVNRELAELIAARQAKVQARNEAHQGGPILDAELVSDRPIELPAPAMRTFRWWKTLSSGSGDRLVTREAALFVLQTLAVQIRGLNGASGLEVDFGDTDPTLAELWSAITEVVGPAGWALLCAKGA